MRFRTHWATMGRQERIAVLASFVVIPLIVVSNLNGDLPKWGPADLIITTIYGLIFVSNARYLFMR